MEETEHQQSYPREKSSLFDSSYLEKVFFLFCLITPIENVQKIHMPVKNAAQLSLRKRSHMNKLKENIQHKQEI